MSKADFSRYLSVEVDAIEAPTVGPLGHYLASFQSWKGAERDYDKANSGPKTPVIELTFKITQPDDDAVEEDASNAQKMVGKLATKDYTLNDETGMFNLKKFVSEICDVDSKTGLGDALDACKGSVVKLFNEPRSGKEEGVFYFNVKKILPV